MQRKIIMMCVMALFGTMGVLVRYIDLAAPELAMFRAIIAALTLFVYKLIAREHIPWRAIKKDLFFCFLAGLALAGDWIFFFKAFQYTTISIATLSYYFAPTLVMLASPFFFKERFTPQKLLCFGAATLGLVLIIGVSGKMGGTTTLGIGCALIGATFYAIVVILNKLAPHVDDIDRTLLQLLAALVILVPYVLLTGGFHLNALDTAGWASLLTLGILHTGIAYCLYFACIKSSTGQEIAIISYFDPLVAVLISALFLGEPLTLWQGIGGALILGFTLFNELHTEKSPL